MASLKINDVQAKVLAALIEKDYFSFANANPEFNNWECMSQMCELKNRLNAIIEKQKKTDGGNAVLHSVKPPVPAGNAGGATVATGDQRAHERDHEQEMAARAPVMDDPSYDQYLDGMMPPPGSQPSYIGEDGQPSVSDPNLPPQGYDWMR